MWFEPIFFTGSLAVFKIAAKPLQIRGGLLATAGGEICSNYFQYRAIAVKKIIIFELNFQIKMIISRTEIIKKLACEKPPVKVLDDREKIKQALEKLL